MHDQCVGCRRHTARCRVRSMDRRDGERRVRDHAVGPFIFRDVAGIAPAPRGCGRCIALQELHWGSDPRLMNQRRTGTDGDEFRRAILKTQHHARVDVRANLGPSEADKAGIQRDRRPFATARDTRCIELPPHPCDRRADRQLLDHEPVGLRSARVRERRTKCVDQLLLALESHSDGREQRNAESAGNPGTPRCSRSRARCRRRQPNGLHA